MIVSAMLHLKTAAPVGAQGFDFADIFDDLFGDFMGGGGQRRRGGAARGSDMRYNLEVSLKDAFAGKTASIDIPTTISCDPCGGTGAEPGTQPEACPSCHGQGKVRTQQGFFMVERTCPACSGTGRIIANPCKTCRGQGRTHKDKNLNVKIPKGVEDGTRIRLAGEGEAGALGGPPGDLYIFISVAPHKVFQRDGTTIYCRVPIPMTTAALGGELEVPTIDGKRAKLKVPNGAQTGKQFRLRGKGMPQLNSSHTGDMIVECFVETPVNLTKRQKELLREFTGEGGANTSPESEGFFTKVKELWDDLTD